MNQDGKTIIKLALIALSITIIIGYSLFQARNIIKGPRLTITSPASGQTTNSPLVDITGNAKNITFISLNNRQIFVDGDGNFNEELLLSPGYNVWTLQAKDKFGRVVSKRIELVFNKT